MPVKLLPGDLAFEYGSSLPPLDANHILVQIITRSDDDGTIISAQLQVVYDINPASVVSPNLGNELKANQVGLPSQRQIHSTQGGDIFSVTYAGNTPYLNLKLPLADIKRDWGN